MAIPSLHYGIMLNILLLVITFYGSTFGPSTPGHIDLISGQAIGALPANTKIPPSLKFDGVVNGTLKGDIDPKFDDCSRNSKLYNVTIAMQGKNLGDLMNAKGVTWGWFSGGFRLLTKTGNATLDCNSRQSHTSTRSSITTLLPIHIIFLQPQ